jgi:hypothetical protein
MPSMSSGSGLRSPERSSNGAPTGRAGTPSAISPTIQAGFAAPGQDLEAWGAHKRKVNGAKQWIKVGLSRVAMFRYPRERDFVVVTFDQDYKSSGLSNVMRKRQYWVKEGASWKIIYEGAG